MTTATPYIEAYLAHLRRRRCSLRTVATYETVLRIADRELPRGLTDVVTSELAAWLHQPDRWAAKTQALYTTVLREFYRWGVRTGQCDEDVTADLESPILPRRLPNPATYEQVCTILTAEPGPDWPEDRRARLADVQLWSTIAAYSGARAEEIALMRRADITPDWMRIIGKGNKERIVPTHPLAWHAVADLPPGRIAGGINGRQLSNRAWKMYHRWLGVPIGIHKIRGYFVSTTLHATGDLAAVQDLAGHASPVTTRIYAAPSEAQMRAAVATLPAIASVVVVPAAAAAAASHSG